MWLWWQVPGAAGAAHAVGVRGGMGDERSAEAGGRPAHCSRRARSPGAPPCRRAPAPAARGALVAPALPDGEPLGGQRQGLALLQHQPRQAGRKLRPQRHPAQRGMLVSGGASRAAAARRRAGLSCFAQQLATKQHLPPAAGRRPPASCAGNSIQPASIQPAGQHPASIQPASSQHPASQPAGAPAPALVLKVVQLLCDLLACLAHKQLLRLQHCRAGRAAGGERTGERPRAATGGGAARQPAAKHISGCPGQAAAQGQPAASARTWRVELLEPERVADGGELAKQPVAQAHLVGEEVARACNGAAQVRARRSAACWPARRRGGPPVAPGRQGALQRGGCARRAAAAHPWAGWCRWSPWRRRPAPG